MKWVLILVLCDHLGMPLDAITSVTVESKQACKVAASEVKANSRFIRPICVPRTGDITK